MNIGCPHCRQTLKIPDKLRGRTVQCPKCQGKFEVPVRGGESKPTQEQKGASRQSVGSVSAGESQPSNSPEVQEMVRRIEQLEGRTRHRRWLVVGLLAVLLVVPVIAFFIGKLTTQFTDHDRPTQGEVGPTKEASSNSISAESSSQQTPAEVPAAEKPALEAPPGVVVTVLGDTRLRHPDSVKDVAFSPDGTRLASCRDYRVKVWETTTGVCRQSIEANSISSRYFECVAFSPDSRLLAAGSIKEGGGAVGIWEASTGQLSLTLLGHKSGVNSVSFSPDGKTLASASSDNTVKVWNVATGRESFQILGHTESVESVSFSPDGRMLASGSQDKTVKVWEVTTGKLLHTLRAHTERVTCVAFSPDGTLLASASGDSIVISDAATGRSLKRLTEKSVSWVAFTTMGNTLSSASWDGTLKFATVKLWDPRTGNVLRTVVRQPVSIGRFAFSTDGQTLATCGWKESIVRLWDVSTGQERLTRPGHTRAVQCVAFSPDERIVASGSLDTTIKLWDASTGQESRTLNGHTSFVKGIAFSPDGHTLASASWDETVKLWDVAMGRVLQTLSHGDEVRCVSFCPDGRVLASGSDDHQVRLWKIPTGEPLRTLSGHSGYVNSLAFSANGDRLATVGSGGGANRPDELMIWDVNSGARRLQITWPIIFDPVAMSADGRQVLIGGAERHKEEGPGPPALILWDAVTRKQTRSYSGLEGAPACVAFGSDGQTVMAVSSCSSTRGVGLVSWDIQSGNVQSSVPIRARWEELGTVVPALSPSGRYLALGSETGVVYLLRLRDR